MKTSSPFLFKCSQYLRGTLLGLVCFFVATICVFADPPTVTITQPADGTTFSAPADVTIEATVSDSDGGVTGVDFVNFGCNAFLFPAGYTLLGTVATPPYRFTLTNLLSGGYSIFVFATDNGGTGYSTVNFSFIGPIQSLVNAATPGSTVDIPAGVYHDLVVINKNLTLRGAGARSTTIDGNNRCQATLVITGGATVTLSGLTVTRGGILNNGTLTVNDCAITGNSTFTEDRGVQNTISGTAFLNNCTVSGNADGGIANAGTMILNGCTISGNDCCADPSDSGGDGGGLSNNGTLSLNNCTVTGNNAEMFRGGGGGLGGGIANFPPGTVSCKSTIIANNSDSVSFGVLSPDFYGDLNSQGYNLIGNTAGTVILGITTGNLLNIASSLGPLQNNGGPTDTHALPPGSPAIDAGISGGPNTDQRGFSRPIDIPSLPNAADGSDIGAYEFDGAPTLNISLAPVNAQNQRGTLHTLTATVTNDIPTAGTPVPNTLVTFKVISGPNAGLSGTGTTDTSGVASFSYTGLGGIGVDVIQASFVDSQQRIHVSNNVTEDWLDSGSPLAWGVDNFGQLGDGNFSNAAIPVRVSGLTTLAAIAGGFDHSLALKSDGTVWAWGSDYYGQLGDGSFHLSGVARPIQVSGFTGAVAIACGFYHNLALKSDGTVWSWGRGFEGQLGNGIFYYTPPGVATPVQVRLSHVRAIAGGDAHSLALKSDGTVWAWGYGYNGQLGDGNFYLSREQLTRPYGVAIPVQVSGLITVTAIACGASHSLALKSDGSVWAWGQGHVGQLGDGNFYITGNQGVATPVQVSGLSGGVAIAGGGAHSLALKSDGTVWAWGSGGFGQLGDGNFYADPPYGVATPVQVRGLSSVVAIAGGYGHSLAVKSDGTVWAWGKGDSGQLGDGNFYTDPPYGVATPILTSGLAQPVRAVAAGAHHSFALPAVGANTPPVFITCPVDIVANNDPGQCSAVVNYPVPLVSGGTGSVVVVCNPPSGSAFPVGPTTVTCTATDASGSAATCSFIVTVNDIELPKGSCAAIIPFQILQNPLRKVGRFQLLASDNCDPNPKIYIGDSRSSFVAGPFHNFDLVEIGAGPSLTPNQHAPNLPLGPDTNIVNIDFEGVTGSIGDFYLPRGVKFFEGNNSYGRSTAVLGSAVSLVYPGAAVSGTHLLVPKGGGNNDIVVYFFDGAGNRTEADFAEVHNDLEADPATIILAGFNRNGSLITSTTFTGGGIAGAITAPHMWYAIVASAPGTSGLLGVDDFSFSLDVSAEVTMSAPIVAVVFTKGDPLVWAVDSSGNASTPVKCK